MTKTILGVSALLGVFAVSCNEIPPPEPPIPCPEAIAADCPEVPCPCPTPTPEPTPAPIPTPDPSPLDMLLRRSGSVFILNDTQEPVRVELAIACCAAWPIQTGWPQTTTEFIDFTSANMTAVQMRLGPYLEAAEPEAPYGAAYLEIGGKADLSQFNPRFFSGHRQTIEYARSKGKYVFIDIADGWAMKHAQGIGFPLPHPWKAENNVQGEDHITAAGNTLDAVHLNWVDKVVQEFGPYDNVVWMDGVEISQAKGYNARWSIEMRDWARKFEATFGYPVHLFGTNGNDEAQRADIDFIVDHGSKPELPRYGKPLITTEYNPKTPMTAAKIIANNCAAKTLGSYYALWRHTMAQDDVDNALANWGECGTQVVHCVPPGEPESNWGPPRTRIFRKPTMQYAVEAAKLAVGDQCGEDPGLTLILLSNWLNGNGFCASGAWGRLVPGTGDALALKADGEDGENGWYEEWHPVFFKNGCYLNKFKNSWNYKGE